VYRAPRRAGTTGGSRSASGGGAAYLPPMTPPRRPGAGGEVDREAESWARPNPSPRRARAARDTLRFRTAASRTPILALALRASLGAAAAHALPPPPGLGAQAAPAPAAAADQDRGAAALHDPNGHPFRTRSGSPLEPVHRLAVVGVSRQGETRAAALAHLGDRLGLWIRRGPGVELSGALHAGVFSRFDLERPDQELLQVHYRAGFVFRLRAGALAARAEIYHVSSHLGDEFLTRTGREPISTSREGVEVLVQAAPLAGFLLYGGPGVLLRSSEGFDRLSLRGGAEWRQRPGPATRLYASIDAFAWAESEWDPMIALEAGLAFGRHARLGALAGFGPSRAEQFFRESETLAGLAFSFTR